MHPSRMKGNVWKLQALRGDIIFWHIYNIVEKNQGVIFAVIYAVSRENFRRLSFQVEVQTQTFLWLDSTYQKYLW